ncbi:hypothetical protein QYE76_053727 [Lolium multiflorum]|uniref:Uncharacterized protein n=1 Tax=Lolium multiflorum TaxID=4521 RepID=A0AAD8SY27_LOLMU|nr:hypothetical protein QYE76_053727 [Lolium multiflorum]
MDAEKLESLLESMLQLSLDSPQESDGVADQLAAAVPAQAQPAAAAEPNNRSAGEWAEVLVSQLVSATSVEDARCRAAGILEAFGGSVCSRAAQVHGDKDRLLRTAMEHNSLLKRAVVAQHRRRQEDEEKGRELQGQILRYREQVKRLEADKYALSVHLRNAGPGSSMPGNYHPEVF